MLYTRGAVVLLRKSLTLLRSALIKTGIGALVVGAGHLIERLFTLKKAIGGFGAAFKLAGGVVMQTLKVLPTFFVATLVKFNEMSASMSASFLAFLAKTSGAMPDWVNSLIATMVSAGQSIGIVWEGLKGTIFNIMVSIANTVTSLMQKAVNGLITAANIVPGVDIKPITEGFGQIKIVADKTLTGVGQQIDNIFASNSKRQFVGKGGSIGEKLIGSADAAQKRADAFGAVADALFGKAKSAIPAWQQLTDLLNKADAAQNKFDVRDLFGGGKKKDDKKKGKKNSLIRELERVQADAKKAIGILGATFGDNNIDFSIDRIRTSISKLSNIPAPRMAHIVTEVEAIRGRIKSLAAPIQAEKAKLDAILSSDLKTINPDKFMADTLEITTRIQEMTQPIRTEIAAINELDPRLSVVDTDFFDQSLTDTVNNARTQMDRLRGVVGEVHNVPAIKLPKIDTAPVKKQVSDLMAFVQDLGRTVGNSVKTNIKGLIQGTTSLRDALGNVLDQMASKILDFAIDSLFKNIGGAFGAGGGGGLLGGFFGSVFSFDGGGFTGKGSRSGGVDGKGGFPAILHPNETVVDHTKTQRNPKRGDMSNIAMGYSGGGQSAPVTITNQNYFNGVTREEVMRDVEQSQKQMKRQIEGELPSQINKHRFNQNRGVA